MFVEYNQILVFLCEIIFLSLFHQEKKNCVSFKNKNLSKFSEEVIIVYYLMTVEKNSLCGNYIISLLFINEKASYKVFFKNNLNILSEKNIQSFAVYLFFLYKPDVIS